jgi:Mrp family chromosome partitioning ATPase
MTEHRAADDHGTTDGPDAEHVDGGAAAAEGVRSGPESAARPDDRNGRIITFYSYKGGTGRTMALANTAWILASNGFRVLAVDWDLEAPGLARFFEPFLAPEVQAATSGAAWSAARSGTASSPGSARTRCRWPGSGSSPAAAWTSSRRAG